MKRSQVLSLFTFCFGFFCLFLGGQSCKSNSAESTPAQTMTFTENKLIKLYRNGEVNLCSWKNRKVYSCQLNAYDSGFEIFDINCQKLGGCYYQTNNYPEMCEELTNCQTLYRTDKNIWGRPPVVYGSGTPTEKEEE